MSKITCSMCRNEENKFCLVKKNGIHVNKRRDCDKFVLEPSKVKERDIVQTVKLYYEDRETLKKQAKEQLKAMRAEQTRPSYDKSNYTSSHPLTGDLSRFKSSAGDVNANPGGKPIQHIRQKTG